MNRSRVFAPIFASVSGECFLPLIPFFSPLVALYRGFKARDLSHVSRLLSMVQVVQSSLWVAAAVMLPDTFVLIVNAIGLGFACVQVSVIAVVGVLQRRDAAAGRLEPEAVRRVLLRHANVARHTLLRLAEAGAAARVCEGKG